MIIKTESGSTYEYNEVESTLFRLPTEDVQPWSELRRDREYIPVIKAEYLAVGECAIFILNLRGDGVLTVRQTSPIIEIIH